MTRTRMNREQKRVLGATLVGTTVEWYDFFIYANAAAIIFATQYFGPLGEENPQLAQLLSYASIGISFLFRPFGSVLAGWVGDKYGRRMVLMLTLGLMGVATTAMGLLPTYASIGVAAPILLVILRILQGISAGGEWGGAALMAVEHAPRQKRGLFGAYPQVGVPAGMLLASSVLGIAAWVLDEEQFQAWGWRIPFLISFILIFVGFYIRRQVAESPVYQEMKEVSAERKSPLKTLFKEDTPTIIKAALSFAGNNAAGYMIVGGFILGYTTNTLGLSRGLMLFIIALAAVCWIVSTLAAGALSDKFGRRPVYVVGYAWQAIWVIPMFLLIDTGNLGLIILGVFIFTVPIGLTYGPQSALFAEMFPASTRLSGASISFGIGSILGGAFAPMIAQLLVNETGHVASVGVYLAIMGLISLVAILIIGETKGRKLSPNEDENK